MALVGIAMAVGVGVAAGVKTEARMANADTVSVASTTYSSGSFTGDLTWSASGGEDKTSYYLMRDNNSAQIVSAAFNVSSSSIDLTEPVTFTLNTRTFGGTQYNTSDIVAYSDSTFSTPISDTCSVEAASKNLADASGTLNFNDAISPANIYFKITSSTTTAAYGPGISEISFTYTEVSTAAIHTITTSVTNGTYSGDTQIQEGKTASVTISPNNGYKLPVSVTVTGATSNYNSTTGLITLSNATSDVSISAEMAKATQYDILTSLTGLTATGDTKIYENGSATLTLSVIDSATKTLPSTISVTNSVTYNYNSSTGVVTITGATGNVTITASAISKPAERTETFEFDAESNWTATGTTYGGYTKTVDLVTVRYDKTSDANSIYWNPTRLYNNMPIVISAVTGPGAVIGIKTITFYAGSSSYAGKITTISNTVGGGSVSGATDGNNRVFTATGTVTSVTITATGRADVSKIVVVYDRDQSEVDLESISATCAPVLVSQKVKPVISFTPSGASNKNVSYEFVENTSSLADVAIDGTITAKAAGTAKLKITPEDTHADPITINVTINALPDIQGVTIGKKYAMTSSGYELKSFIVSGENESRYSYAEGVSYSGTPNNVMPVKVVPGLYANTIAFQIEINEEIHYLSYESNNTNNSGNHLSYNESVNRESSWICATIENSARFRNVDSYGRVLSYYKNGNRLACYAEATITGGSKADYAGFSFVEIEEVKTDKEYVQDFVDLYMHMTDYDQGGTIGSDNGSGWCSDGQHAYYLTAKSGYNQLIHGVSARENLFANDSDFTAAKTRYQEWARINNDADPYDGYNVVHTPINGSKVIAKDLNNSSSAAVILIVASTISLISVGGYFVIRRRKENN